MIHELFKNNLKSIPGEILVKVEVILGCTYRGYKAEGTLEKNGGGLFENQWVSRDFSFAGDPYKKDADFEAEGHLEWTSHTGKVKAYSVESVGKDPTDPAVIVVKLHRKQKERGEIKLRGANLNQWAKQVKDFLRACEFVRNPNGAAASATAQTLLRSGGAVRPGF